MLPRAFNWIFVVLLMSVIAFLGGAFFLFSPSKDMLDVIWISDCLAISICLSYVYWLLKLKASDISKVKSFLMYKTHTV